MAAPPYVVFLAIADDGQRALYTVTGSSGQQQTAVTVEYAATDSTDTNLIGETQVTVPLYFADATGDSARKIKDRVEDAVLNVVTGGSLPGATASNVSFVWVN